MRDLKLATWNVNGIRASAGRAVKEFLASGRYDIICLQETKIGNHLDLPEELINPDGYLSFWNDCLERKGYSGVAVYTKLEPKSIKINFGHNSLLSKEGRVLGLDFGDFILFNIYFPNGGSGEVRLKYKLKFYEEFLDYANKLLKKGRKIIVTGDFNTAHEEIDLARPNENVDNSGFTPVERKWIDKYLEAGFVDIFRAFHKEGGLYSYWDIKSAARDRNVGWRIDYFLVSKNLAGSVKDSKILADVYGSDHAPVVLVLH